MRDWPDKFLSFFQKVIFEKKLLPFYFLDCPSYDFIVLFLMNYYILEHFWALDQVYDPGSWSESRRILKPDPHQDSGEKHPIRIWIRNPAPKQTGLFRFSFNNVYSLAHYFGQSEKGNYDLSGNGKVICTYLSILPQLSCPLTGRHYCCTKQIKQ